MISYGVIILNILKKAVIPKGVNFIAENAFEGCENLTIYAPSHLVNQLREEYSGTSIKIEEHTPDASAGNSASNDSAFEL